MNADVSEPTPPQDRAPPAGGTGVRTSATGRSQLLLAGGFLATLLVSLVSTMLLGRALSPAVFGFYGLIVALFAFARDLMDLGASATAAREMALRPDREVPMLEALVVWRRSLGVALCLLILLLALVQTDPDRRWMLVATGLTMLALGPIAFSALFQARQAHGAATLIYFLSQVFMLALVLTMLSRGLADAMLVVPVILRELFVIVGIALIGHRMLGMRLQPGLRGRQLSPFLRAAGFWAGAALCRHVGVQTETFMLYLLRPAAELGAYSAAYRPLFPMLTLVWLTALPLIPLFTRAAAHSRQAFGEVVAAVLPMAVVVGVTVASFGVVLAAPAIDFMYAGRYLHGPLDASVSLAWLAVSMAPDFLLAVCSVALLALHREREVCLVMLVALLMRCMANLLLLPMVGYAAAAPIAAGTELLTCAGLAWLLHLERRRRMNGTPMPAEQRDEPQPGRWLTAVLAPPVAAVLTWAVAAALDLSTLPHLGAGLVLAAGLGGWLLTSRVGRDYFAALQASESRTAGQYGKAAA